MQKPKTKARVGRPTGYVHPANCRITDAVAFRGVVELLVLHAVEGPRGGASQVAYVLDVSAVLIHHYRQKAPRAITPRLTAALKRAPLLMQRYPFPFDD